MELDVLVWFGIAWFVGAFVNSITGFGASMVAMPIALMAMNLQTAIASCALMVLAVSFEQIWRYGKFADWPRLTPILIGALPGVLGGMAVVHYLPTKHLQIVLGFFIMLYALWGLWGSGKIAIGIHKAWGYVAGVFSTIFGIAFSFNGIPLGIYVSLSGWNKQASKAGLAVTFVYTGSLMIIGQGLMGMHGTHTIVPLLAGMPTAFVGAWLGFKVSNRLSDGVYRKILFYCLLGSGIVFFYKGMQTLN